MASFTLTELTPCAECGMPCRPDEYHPYAACLMFKQCHNSQTVRDNLHAVEYGALRAALAAALAERDRAVKDARRYRWLRANHRNAPNFHELGRIEWYLPRVGCRGFMTLDDAIDSAITSAAIAAGGEGDRHG